MGDWKPSKDHFERKPEKAPRAEVDPVTPREPPELTLRELSRQQAFDAYFSAQIGMNWHPGTTRDKQERRTLEDMAKQATKALAIRDALFNDY